MATRLQVQYVPDSATLHVNYHVLRVHRDLTPPPARLIARNALSSAG